MARWFLALILSVLPAALVAATPVSTAISIQASHPNLADHVREIIDQVQPQLHRLTGGAPRRIKVVVADGHDEFNRQARKLGGPVWAAGLALPAQGLILLRPPSSLTEPGDFRHLLIHEMTHLYLARALKMRRAPLWLEEGLAMYVSGEAGWGRAQAMTRGVLMGRLIPFKELERSFPSSTEEAALAYAQSYYLVSYLLDEYGPGSIEVILKDLAWGREVTTAIYAITGKGLVAVEADFRKAMSARFSWLVLLGTAGVLWGVVALTAAVALVVRRRAQVRRLKEMDDAHLDDHRPASTRHYPPPHRKKILDEAGLGKRGAPDESNKQ